MSNFALRSAKNVRKDIDKRGGKSIYPSLVPREDLVLEARYHKKQNDSASQFRIYCEKLFHSTDITLRTMGINGSEFVNGICRSTVESKKHTNDSYNILSPNATFKESEMSSEHISDESMNMNQNILPLAPIKTYKLSNTCDETSPPPPGDDLYSCDLGSEVSAIFG